MRIAVIWLVAGLACHATDPPKPAGGDDGAPVGETCATIAPTIPDTTPGDTALPTTEPLTWVMADAGSKMSCGLVSDGSLRCWGEASCFEDMPTDDRVFTQVNVGIYNACALDEEGSVVCWCCHDVVVEGQAMCPLTPAGHFTRVLVGDLEACAQDAAGILTCWGDPWGPKQVGEVPKEPVIDFAMESSYNAALLADGSISWWGYGTQWGGAEPPAGVALTDLALGRLHACGLDGSGNAWCWGTDALNDRYPDAPPGPWAQIDAFSDLSCLLDAAGHPTCLWGIGYDLDEWDATFPAVDFAQIGLGEWLGCGVDVTGQAWCWGADPTEQPSMRVPAL